MGLMIKYVDFLNAWNEEETVDFSIVEEFWAEQVREYFRNQPFVLTADTSETKSGNAVFGNGFAALSSREIMSYYA